MKPDVLKSKAPLGHLIHEVARLIKRRFEEEAKLHGLTLPQWRSLAMIAQTEQITQAALANAIDADPMTMSGILDRLEKRGLIERYADPTDSRAKRARLTAEGDVLFQQSRLVGLALYETALQGVTPEEQSAAIGTLSRMRDNLMGLSAREKEDA